jgi:hypothetical protein
MHLMACLLLQMHALCAQMCCKMANAAENAVPLKVGGAAATDADSATGESLY